MAQTALRAIAEGSTDPFYTAKLQTARFYFARLFPETATLMRRARTGSRVLMDTDVALGVEAVMAEPVADKPASASVGQPSAVGLWRAIHAEGKPEKSLVRITESEGVLTGKVETIHDPEEAKALCTACKDERKNQPMLGLTILRNVREVQEGVWDGGDILDPIHGKQYKVRLQLLDGGRKLEVRGYVGTPMLGQSQVWVRAEA